MRKQKAEGRTQKIERGREWGVRAARRAAAGFAVIAILVFATGAAAAHQQNPQPTPAQEGFVPVDKLPSAQEQLPAAPLVMGAYAVAWVAIFGYLVSIWTRLGKVEREIQVVSRRVESGGRR
jgi:CcmD family protein